MDVAKVYRDRVEEVRKLTEDMKNSDGTLKEHVTQEDIDKLNLVIDKLENIRKKYRGQFEDIAKEAKELEKESKAIKTSYEKDAAKWTEKGNKLLGAMSGFFNADGEVKDSVTQEDVNEFIKFAKEMSI